MRWRGKFVFGRYLCVAFFFRFAFVSACANSREQIVGTGRGEGSNEAVAKNVAEKQYVIFQIRVTRPLNAFP